MARIVLLTYGGDLERTLRRDFADAGHDFRPIEPAFPQCKANVDHADPQAFLLDLSSRPSHVREAIGYFADLKRFRQVPVMLVSDDPADLSKVSFKVSRCQHALPGDALARVEAALAK
jgi:hypothetical protein